VATKRVQTPRQQPNQVRLQPQASVVDTFVRPARNDQISRALDSVTGAVKRVEVKEERRLDMIQASKKQSAQNTFNIGYRALIDQEQFARMSPEQLTETPEYQKLFNTSLDMVDDEDLKGILSSSMSSSAFATSNATSQQWVRQDLRDAGAEFASATFSIGVDEGQSLFNLTPTNAAHGPDGMDREMLREELLASIPDRIKNIESVLKEKYGYSNTDLQNFWLKEQEKRGIQYEDTLIGDYLLEAGFGGPDFRNKVIALIEKADNAKLRSDIIGNIDNLMDWKDSAALGTFTVAGEEDIAARIALEDELITPAQYEGLHATNKTAVAKIAGSDRKNTAVVASVNSILSGGTPNGSYVDWKGDTVQVSKQDAERAAQEHINNLAQAGGGTPEEILSRQIALYSNANVLNEQWVATAGKAFDNLGTGNFVVGNPQFDTTMKKFKLLKQIHAGNPQMFRKYLTDSAQRAQFAEWRLLTQYGDSEVDALAAIGSPDYLESKASPARLQKFAEGVIAELDTWGWGDVVTGEEAKTLLSDKIKQYGQVIARTTGMLPSDFIKEYAKEIVDDHSVVNGKLVFMGGGENISNAAFQEDAQAYFELMAETIGAGTFDPTQLSLRYSGRGKTFWITNLRGMTIPNTLPLHLDTFNGLNARQVRDAKQLEANNDLANQ
jgi:predicted outer membrane protein